MATMKQTTTFRLQTQRNLARDNAHVARILAAVDLVPEHIETRFDGRRADIRVVAPTDMDAGELTAALKDLFVTDQVEIVEVKNAPTSTARRRRRNTVDPAPPDPGGPVADPDPETVAEGAN